MQLSSRAWPGVCGLEGSGSVPAPQRKKHLEMQAAAWLLPMAQHPEDKADGREVESICMRTAGDTQAACALRNATPHRQLHTVLQGPPRRH